MKAHRNFEALRVLFALAALTVLVGCNGPTDDPDVADALITVNSVSPTTACVDVDGERVDFDGDGTFETAFVSVVQAVNFDSRLRTGSGGEFNDVIFDQVEITYAPDLGPPIARRREGIAVTVPSGGVASFPLTTVLADDVARIGTTDARGTITVKFTGKDAGGERATASGKIPLEAATACGG